MFGSSTFHEYSPERARELIAEGNAVLIDIREPDEFAREWIPGAQNLPLSGFDPARVAGDKDKAAIFHCRSGNRTREARAQLRACGFAEVGHVAGGLNAWQAANLPVERDPGAPLPIQRQVQITAGALVFLGVVLGTLVHAGWFILSGFVGAGLMFAGVSGWCGMAKVLEVMPWNRSRPEMPASS